MNQETNKFAGKFVVITGAAGGIGQPVTRRFLNEGAKVCAVDIDTDALEKLPSEFDMPDNLSTFTADISSEKDCRDLAEKLKQDWGKLDILINNAGWYPIVSFEEMTYQEWRKVIEANLDGPYLMTRALLPLIKKSESGRIIIVSSASIFAGVPDQCHYVAAKSGLIGFARSLAKVVGEDDITVNIVTPGLTVTPPVKKKMPKEMLEKAIEARAIKREEKAEDLVGAMVFLASDDADFVTGQTINVDGGSHFH